MTITINGVEITKEEIEHELVHFSKSKSPQNDAIQSLVLRELLLQECQRRSLDLNMVMAALEEPDVEQFSETLDKIFSEEDDITILEPTDQECETYYKNNPQRFNSSEIIESSHILFKVDDTSPVDEVRPVAEKILQQVLEKPELFGELAKKYSECPSGEMNGSLGQTSHGQMVPEFEAVAFSLQPGQIAPKLVETRFGLHIIRLENRAEGKLLPFEAAKDKIANYLSLSARRWAVSRYMHLLASRAEIQGVKLPE
jgi:peptidyl-prolyl cis-trans isomerase C